MGLCIPTCFCCFFCHLFVACASCLSVPLWLLLLFVVCFVLGATLFVDSLYGLCLSVCLALVLVVFPVHSPMVLLCHLVALTVAALVVRQLPSLWRIALH